MPLVLIAGSLFRNLSTVVGVRVLLVASALGAANAIIPAQIVYAQGLSVPVGGLLVRGVATFTASLLLLGVARTHRMLGCGSALGVLIVAGDLVAFRLNPGGSTLTSGPLLLLAVFLGLRLQCRFEAERIVHAWPLIAGAGLALSALTLLSGSGSTGRLGPAAGHRHVLLPQRVRAADVDQALGESRRRASAARAARPDAARCRRRRRRSRRPGRPARAGRPESASTAAGAGGAGERLDLLGSQDAEVAGGTYRLAVESGDGVRGQAEVALGALEDRVQHEQVLVDRARCEAPLGDEVGAVGVHELGADRAQRQVAE